MEKINLDITDRRFEAARAASYELALLVGTDGLSFSIADGAGEVLALKSWFFPNPTGAFKQVEPAVRRILAGDEKLRLPFGRVRCAVFNHAATLVPNRLFNPAELPAYFNLLLRAAIPLNYHFDELPDLDSKLVFAIESSTAKVCEQYFPKEKPTHASAALLRAWQRLARRNDYDVFLNLRNQVAQIAVFDRRHLLFFNTFSFQKASDCLYFTLLPFEQLRLNPLETPLTLSGELMPDSEIYRLLYRYIRDLRFAQLPDFYQFPGAIQALPAHLNFDLYALKQG